MEDIAGGGGKLVRAEVPLAEMFGYSTSLRSATQGRATYTMEFKQYAETPANVSEGVINAKVRARSRAAACARPVPDGLSFARTVHAAFLIGTSGFSRATMHRDSSDGTIPMPPTPALRRLLILYAGLIAANAAVWRALAVLRDHPLLLGTAAIAYGLGCVMRSTPITSPRSTLQRAS